MFHSPQKIQLNHFHPHQIAAYLRAPVKAESFDSDTDFDMDEGEKITYSPGPVKEFQIFSDDDLKVKDDLKNRAPQKAANRFGTQEFYPHLVRNLANEFESPVRKFDMDEIDDDTTTNDHSGAQAISELRSVEYKHVHKFNEICSSPTRCFNDEFIMHQSSRFLQAPEKQPQVQILEIEKMRSFQPQIFELDDQIPANTFESPRKGCPIVIEMVDKNTTNYKLTDDMGFDHLGSEDHAQSTRQDTQMTSHFISTCSGQQDLLQATDGHISAIEWSDQQFKQGCDQNSHGMNTDRCSATQSTWCTTEHFRQLSISASMLPKNQQLDFGCQR